MQIFLTLGKRVFKAASPSPIEKNHGFVPVQLCMAIACNICNRRFTDQWWLLQLVKKFVAEKSSNYQLQIKNKI
jgi:hypothetical protein